MALSSVLPPGYRAFVAKQQANEQGEMVDLQKVEAVRGMLARMQQQQKARNYEAELAALGAAPTQEQLVQVASKYAGPEKTLDIHQRSVDRQATVEASRASAAERAAAARQASEDRRDAAKQMIDLRYDTLAQQTANEEQRRGLEARRIEEKAVADRRHDETLRLLGQLRAEAKPKAPLGFRFKDDGSLEAIPGGPKDTAPKDLARAKGAVQKADTVIKAVDEALTQTGPLTTGTVGAVLGHVPGTAAYDLDGTLDTIKANLGFAELQAMRDASPTGGALGQVAIQELQMLQSTLASLKRGLSKDKLEKGLRDVRTRMENWKKAVADSNPDAAAPAPAPVPAAPAGGTPTIRNDAEYNALPRGTEFVGPDGKKRKKP